MKAIIPAAGYATRLYPMTKDQPKSLLEVKGRPMIEHIIRKISELKEISEVLIVTNSRFYPAFDYWLEEFQPKCRLKIILLNDHTESNDDRLGTIGDLKYVFDESRLDEDFLVINGDNLFNFGLEKAFSEFKSSGKPLIGLYGGLSKQEVAGKFGVVEVKGNKVVGFEEKPAKPKSSLVSTGIYFYPKRVIGLMRQYLKEGNKPDAPGYFLEWLHKREEVKAFVFSEKWFDVGSFEQLGKAREEFTG